MAMDQTIRMIHGTDGRAMALALLEAQDAVSHIPAGASVILKPNLVVARPASGGATTHPEIVRGAIEYLRGHGIRDIAIMEGSWVGDDTCRAFERCGYSELARRYGVELVDLKGDSSRPVETPIGPIRVCTRILDGGYLINLPVLKGHCQTVMTCALKNLKGCIPDNEKRRFHTMGLHKPIAALAAAIRPGLTLVDSLCGDPGFEEGGDPVTTNRMYIGTDPVQLDVLGCRLLDLDPARVPYIALAETYGAGSRTIRDGDVLEIGLDGRPADSAAKRDKKPGMPSRTTGFDEVDIREDQACSACASALAKALDRLRSEGMDLSRLPPIHIGQGYLGCAVNGIGLGKCAGGTVRPGEPAQTACPPASDEIIALLRKVSL